MTLRYRITFGKDGSLRYISHLDLARTWERTLRRAGVPLIYSQGFTPRPKLQLAAALPLGYGSVCELMDVWLGDDAPSPEALQARLPQFAPPGLNILHVESTALNAPALQSVIRAATYRATLDSAVDLTALRVSVEAVLASEMLPRERRGKSYNLRPLIYALEVMPLVLGMTLALTAQGAGRPDEVLDTLGLEPHRTPIVRVGLHFADDPIAR